MANKKATKYIKQIVAPALYLQIIMGASKEKGNSGPPILGKCIYN